MLMGARAAPLVRAPAASTSNYFKFFTGTIVNVVVVLSLYSSRAFSQVTPDADALLKFRNSLTNVVALSSWDPSINPKPPCSGQNPNWVGVGCMDGHVWSLRLENMGLMGKVDMDSLVSLRYLRSLSLMNNTFAGTMPNVKILKNLRALFLSYNHFSGEIPDDAFAGMYRLKKVLLANNEFSGKIPTSLAALPNLLVLRLDANKFQGQIPDFHVHKSLMINVSYNDLEGPIPRNLVNMSDASSFTGNVRLCGEPLDPCTAILWGTAKASAFKVLLMVLLVALIIVLIVASFIISRLRSKQRRQQQLLHIHASTSTFQGQPSNKYAPPALAKSKSQAEQDPAAAANKLGPGGAAHRQGQYSKRGDQGKLTFLRDDRLRFDLQDLMKASAEILGSATFGSSYKAVVLDGQAVVVKRYKQMNNVGREEFIEHMRRLGSLSHPNLLPLVAYYYRKEEKLLLSDYVENSCLASHLHGKHNYEQRGLDWPTRLRIVKGIARGLAYLYTALPSLVVPHGHLKSSNVLLDDKFEPLLTDYGLIPVINLDHAQQITMPYKSPEYAQLGRITKKTDVWSLGILILEILTGKFPENYLTQRHNTNSDIASWVNIMVTEKRTGEVFDVEMGGVGTSKSELLKLLKIGLSCCEENVERRMDLREALQQIEELKEGETDPDYFSTLIGGQGDSYSRAV